MFSCNAKCTHVTFIIHIDYYGGQFGDVGHADYLFSESEVAEDTVSIHENQPDDMVIKPDWIASVIHQRKPVGEVSLGEHLLLPQYCYPPHENDNSLQFYTPERDSYDVPPCVTMKEYRLEDVLRSEYRPEDNSTRSNEHTNNETKEQEDKEEIVDKNIEKEQVRKEKEKEQSQNLLKAKDDVPTSTVEGVTIMFPLKGGRYGMSRTHTHTLTQYDKSCHEDSHLTHNTTHAHTHHACTHTCTLCTHNTFLYNENFLFFYEDNIYFTFQNAVTPPLKNCGFCFTKQVLPQYAL